MLHCKINSTFINKQKSKYLVENIDFSSMHPSNIFNMKIAFVKNIVSFIKRNRNAAILGKQMITI